MGSFADHAKNVNAQWDTNDDFENVPDGSYVASLHKAEVKQSKKGFWMLSLQYKVQQDPDNDGKYVGRLCFGLAMFETAKGWNPWKVKEFFANLGVELPEFEDMEGFLDELVGSKGLYEIEIETDGDFTSTNLISVLDETLDDANEKQRPAAAAKPKPVAEAPAEEEEEDEYPSEAEILKMSLKECKELAEDYEIELKGTKVKDVRLELIEAGKEEEEDAPEAEAAAEEGVEADEDSEDLEALTDFCDAQGLEYAESADVDALCDLIEASTFVKEKLTEDEVKLLEDFELEVKYEAAKPAKKVRGRKK